MFSNFFQPEMLDKIIGDYFSIRKTLVRRGYTFESKKTGLSKKLLLDLKPIRKTAADGFYRLMSKESNRAILKRICRTTKFTKEDLCKKWNIKRIDYLLEELLDLGVIIKTDDSSFSVRKREVEYGENFEWYISEMFERELSYTSDWGVHIREAPSGGDYDVLAWAGNNLIYVECKAKKPSDIAEKEIISLLKRDEFLRPHVTILFVDSTSDIDFVENLFSKIGSRIKKLCNRYGIKNSGMSDPPYTERLDDLFFHFQDRLFVLNSRKQILDEFKLCLRHRHRTGEVEQAIAGRFWLHELLLKVEKWWYIE